MARRPRHTPPSCPPLLAAADSFDASDFTSSLLADAHGKARFASHFTRFVAAGLPISLFPTWFYNHLRFTFAVPRHWSRIELHARWFSAPESAADFACRALAHVPSGRADRGYSDVETRLQAWLRDSGAADELVSRHHEAREARERAALRALLARYPDEADCAFPRDPPPPQTELFATDLT